MIVHRSIPKMCNLHILLQKYHDYILFIADVIY